MRASWAIDFITITIAVEDSEIITTDLKRIRLAEPAEVRFALTTNYIELLYGADLTTPRRGVRLEVIAAARGTLGALTGAEATRDEGASTAMIAAVKTAGWPTWVSRSRATPCAMCSCRGMRPEAPRRAHARTLAS